MKAVPREFRQPLPLEGISISKPKGREIPVRSTASGACLRDLHVANGCYQSMDATRKLRAGKAAPPVISLLRQVL